MNAFGPPFTYNAAIKISGGICVFGGYLLLRQLYLNLYRQYAQLPPGDNGIFPFIGCLPNLYLNTYEYLKQIALSHGDISLSFVGYQNIVIISNAKLVKRVFCNKSFVHRPYKAKTNQNVHRRTRPLPFINGEEWTLRRKNFSTSIISMLQSNEINMIAKKVLNDVLFKAIDARIVNEEIATYQECVYDNSQLNLQMKSGVQIYDLLFLAVFNTLHLAAFGEEIAADSKDYKACKEWTEAIFVGKNPFDPGRFNKKFRYLMGFVDTNYKKQNDEFVAAIKNKRDLFYNIVGDKIRNFNPNQLDSFVDHMIANQLQSDGKITQEMIVDDLGTVFTAGTDTTTAAIAICMYYLTLYPAIQSAIYDELTNAMSEDKTSFFELKYQIKCHVFRALIYESLRLYGIGVISPARSCVKDTFITHEDKQYRIPANSVIFLSLVGATLDTKSNQSIYGTNPDKFNLHRFLDENGKFKYNSNFHIFSFGRRDCPGRSLAMKEIVLIVANLVLRYRFAPCNNDYKQFQNDLINNKKTYSVYQYDPQIRLQVTKRLSEQ